MENQSKLQQMQDEMSRFEAEISGTEKSANAMPSRTVINSRTFGVIQQKLDNDIPPPPPPPPVLSGPFGPPMMPSMGTMLPPGLGPGGPNIGGRSVAFPAIPPPPPPPSFVPPQVSRMRAPGPPDGMPTMPGVMPFMRPVTLPGPAAMPPPPKPQPVILTGAPKLYKKEKEEKKEEKDKPTKEKEKKKIELPLPPAAKPAPPPKPMPAAQELQTEAPGKTKKEKKSRKVVRTAGGQTWEDVTLLDWPDDDFRLFAGDLGNDVTDELLIRTFGKYGSFQRAKVVRDKRTNKSKGFGFISFKEPADFIKAMKEMDGRYVGSRPIKLRKSTWRNRSLDVVRKKEKEKAALLSLLMSGKKS